MIDEQHQVAASANKYSSRAAKVGSVNLGCLTNLSVARTAK